MGIAGADTTPSAVFSVAFPFPFSEIGLGAFRTSSRVGSASSSSDATAGKSMPGAAAGSCKYGFDECCGAGGLDGGVT